MAAPSTSALDLFARANGALGANWTNADLRVGAGMPTIVSNLASGAANASVTAAWNNPASFAADQEAWYTGITNAGACDIYVRSTSPNSTATTGYIGVLDAGGTRLSLWTLVNGFQTTNVSGNITGLSAITGLWLQAIGTQLTFYTQSGGVWTQRYQGTDSTYNQAGYIGFDLTSGATPMTINGFAGGALGVAPPTISSFTPATGPIGTQVAITGTNLTGATVVTFNHGTSVTPTSVTATSANAIVPAGTTTGVVGITTPGGTIFSASNFTVGTVTPTISSFSPTTGAVGTTVTVNGTGLTGATGASVNFVAAGSVTVLSDSQVRFTLPSGATTGLVRVTTPGGTAVSSSTFTVSGVVTGGTMGLLLLGAGSSATPPPATPTISSISPTSGATGTSVTITGTNFTSATAVSFNFQSASFTVNSGTSITATVPATASTGTVQVVTPTGTATSSQTFTVTAGAPTISSFSPTSGPAGGTTLTINGTNLNGATVVTINHGTSLTPTVISNTQVTVALPAGTTSGVVGITTPGGTVFTTTSFTVTGGGGGGTSWTVANPGSTGVAITTINHPVGAGVNIHNANDPMTITDTIVVGGQDQSFLVQPLAPGRSFLRCQSVKAVDDGTSVTGNNKHAWYVKAANTTILDYQATAGKGADGGFTVRFAGFLGQRFTFGAGFQLPLCIFADDQVHGSVIFRQGTCIAPSGGWLDCDEAATMVYDVVFDQIAMTSGGNIFCAVNTANFAGTLTITNSTLNGNPVTSSMIQGVPSNVLHIS